MLSAFSYSINIVLNSYFTRQVDPLALGVYQQGFTCLYSIIGLLVFGSPIFPSTALDWISVLGLDLLSSAYGFVVQTVVQQYTTPENTGFLFSLEPIFAAIFSFIFLHEKLTEMGYLGAIFILAGVYRYRCQKYGNGINHRKIRCRSYIQKIAENPLSCPDMLPSLLKIQ